MNDATPPNEGTAPAAVPADNLIQVDRGALQMALNVLRRAGKHEVADALATSAPPPVEAFDVKRVLGYLRTDEAQIRATKAYPAWADTMARAADLIRTLAATHPKEPTADAERYRAFFAAGLPITFMGVEYRTKSELDAAIDAARADQSLKG